MYEWIFQPPPSCFLVSALIDHKARGVDSLSDIERPFLAEFLASVYADYDICVWSQTSWVWLEAKVTELGMMSSPRYKISFLLDRSFMFSIKSKVRGREREHEVKALDVIWAKLPQFSAKNTIHIDDLSRNGAMNPQSLLQITPYKDCLTARHSDHELLFLARYLKIISGAVPDFSSLDHEAWRQYPGVERDLPPPDDRIFTFYN
jgi:ubiquitin-like domain-containing CTD phosphatase 1